MTSTLRVWLGGALAAFIDGFIDGCPVGAPTGAGIVVADGKFPTSTNAGQIAIAAAHIIAIPVLSGLADVRAWKKDNPFPNIFSPRATSIAVKSPITTETSTS